jgi:hypothetical protein
LFVLVLILFVALVPASSLSQEKKPPARREYVGDSVCRSCHQEKAKTYSQTAHHLTSSWPSQHTIEGSFDPDSNILKTSNPYVSFKMTMNGDGYFQSALEKLSASKEISRTERIDIVTGVARKGQSYLYWKGDDLFQLPVTYWTDTNSWVNSPTIRMDLHISTKRSSLDAWSATQATSNGCLLRSIDIARQVWC